jgi:hypothetical protein
VVLGWPAPANGDRQRGALVKVRQEELRQAAGGASGAGERAEEHSDDPEPNPHISVSTPTVAEGTQARAGLGRRCSSGSNRDRTAPRRPGRWPGAIVTPPPPSRKTAALTDWVPRATWFCRAGASIRSQSAESCSAPGLLAWRSVSRSNRAGLVARAETLTADGNGGASARTPRAGCSPLPPRPTRRRR